MTTGQPPAGIAAFGTAIATQIDSVSTTASVSAPSVPSPASAYGRVPRWKIGLVTLPWIWWKAALSGGQLRSAPSEQGETAFPVQRTASVSEGAGAAFTSPARLLPRAPGSPVVNTLAIAS